MIQIGRSNLMNTENHISLIVLSIVIAMLSSGIALYLLEDLSELNRRQRIIRIFSAAWAFSAGVWSMHFIGMLAWKMPVTVAFDRAITLYSYLIAFVGSLPAMWVISHHTLTIRRRLLAAFVISVAVISMHFTGMASLKMQPGIQYDEFMLLMAILCVYAASFIGLTFKAYAQPSRDKSNYLIIAASVILGIASSSMHYTAMEAAFTAPGSVSLAVSGGGLNGQNLIYAMLSSTLLVLVLPLFTVMQGRLIVAWKVLFIIVLAEATVMQLLPVLLPEKQTSWALKTLLDITLLGLFVSPIAWRMNQTSQQLIESHSVIQNNLEVQKINNRLLKVPLHGVEMAELLGQLLEIIFSLSWLKILPKGAFFLKEPSKESLEMIAELNMSPEIQVSCQQVKFGECLCGKAAYHRSIQYCKHVNEEHSVRYDGMNDHGHFIIPLEAENSLLGVLCLYLRPGQELGVFEKSTLMGIGATVSELIHLKQVLVEIDLANTVFEYNFNCLMITDARHRLLNVNPEFTKVTGFQADEVLGKTPAMLKSEKQDKNQYQTIRDILHSRHQWQGEIWNRRKNGENYQQWLSIKAVCDSKNRIQYYVSTFADISEHKEAEEKIHKLAFYDGLTGLANRTLFYDRLKQAMKQSLRTGDKLALLFIDLDRFKEVNDTLGHQAGDELLITVANRISSCLRETDTVARLGGDEFVVILQDLKEEDCVTPARICRKIAEKILYQLAQGHQFEDQVFYGGASIGIVIFPDNASNLNELLKQADTAMYQAKNTGRNTYCFFSKEMAEDVRKQVVMMQALRNVLTNQELILLYQPQVDMDNQSIIGAEALMRWDSPVFGRVMPMDFIPLAEEKGLIYDMGLWVIEQVCRQISQWDGYQDMKLEYVALNVSIHQIVRPEFVEEALNICQKQGVKPGRLELEIIEGGLAQYPETISGVLAELKAAGFRLAIDDFGTEHSSLSRLKSFKVDLLKIDRSFVMEMTEDPDDLAIAQAVIDLADALNLTTLAEGVETVQQFEMLKEMGCQRCQGYYFGQLMSAEELRQRCQQPI